MNVQRILLLEKLGIATFVFAWLMLFNQTLIHGDALRIVGQIDQDHLLWNPNHLLFDPTGYALTAFAQALGIEVSVLGVFEVISIVSTLLTLLIFHGIVVKAGVLNPGMRLASVAAVFSAATFLAMAGSQYYVMMQMPFLVGSLYLYVEVLTRSKAGRPVALPLYGMGVLLAIATAVMFNNLFLAFFGGLAAGFADASRRWNWQYTARVFAASAVVGVPLFVAGYLVGDSNAPFFTWLLSYQGDADTKLNQLYGIKWGLQSLVQGAAMVGFNFSIANMVEHAGLGTVLSVMLFGSGDLEFLPQWGRIILGIVVIPLVLIYHLIVVAYTLRRFVAEPAVKFLGAWLAAFLVFNFFWNHGGEMFWLQFIPATWLLFLMSQGFATTLANAPPTRGFTWATRGRASLVWSFVLLLFTVNTYNVLVPLAARGFADHQIRHSQMLRAGDLEVFPGWDRAKWMTPIESTPPVKPLILMNMALSKDGTEESLERLPEIMRAHLDGGGRVIVARLFDLDHDLTPWYSLASTGWSRERLQTLFNGLCTLPLETIDGVVFREVRTCAAGFQL